MKQDNNRCYILPNTGRRGWWARKGLYSLGLASHVRIPNPDSGSISYTEITSAPLT